MKRFFLAILVAGMVIAGAANKSAAQRPDAPNYALRGPFVVGTKEYRIEDDERPLDITVWYPTANPEGVEEAITYRYGLLQADGRAIQDAAPDSAGGPYPLIIFSHGSGGFRYQSIYYTEHLASYGFVVMAADHPLDTLLERINPPDDPQEQLNYLMVNFALRPLDVLREIAYAETLNGEDEALQGVIDMGHIAVTGHSFGGYTSLATGGARLDFAAFDAWCVENAGATTEGVEICTMGEWLDQAASLRGLDATPEGLWPATTDSRIQAIVPLAPWSPPLFSEAGLAEVSVPTMIIVGSGDQTTPGETNAFPAYEHIASANKVLVVLENADHFIFVEQCTDAAVQFGFFAYCSDAVWDMQRAHDLITHFATAFLLSTLKGDAEASAALDPAVVDFAGIRYERSQ